MPHWPWIFVFACALRAAEVEPVSLTLKRAVELALREEGSVPLQLAREAVVQARSRSVAAKSALLPNLELSAGAQSVTRNLRAMGLSQQTLGFPFPSRVGPFRVLDARGGATQALLDLSSLHRYRGSKSDLLAAESDVELTAEDTAFRVGKAYLAVLHGQARLEAEQANLELTRTTLEAAENSLRAGTVSGLDVARAKLRVASARQKVLEAGTEARNNLLALRRAIGLRLDAAVEVAGRLEELPPPVEVDKVSADSLDRRPEWRSQKLREEAAAAAVRSSRAESLPSIQAFADYGSVGTGMLSNMVTHTTGVAVRFPVFDGGRRRANAEASASRLRQERSRAQDLREEIRFQLEVAGGKLRSTREAVELAASALDHARRVLEQSQRRYRNGAAGHLSVAEAENDVVQARTSHIEALHACHAAWIDFHRAAGVLRQEVGQRF